MYRLLNYLYLYILQKKAKLSKWHLSGGKNSSTGKLSLSKSSQGLLSADCMQSFEGIQKSITGMQSSTLRVRRTMVKRPMVTNTLLPSAVSTKMSSNTLHTSSGTELTSISPQQQQQLLSVASSTLVARQMGSTTSVCDSFLRALQEFAGLFGRFLGARLQAHSFGGACVQSTAMPFWWS